MSGCCHLTPLADENEPFFKINQKLIRILMDDLFF